jgi:AraC-like DNA-binding protein
MARTLLSWNVNPMALSEISRAIGYRIHSVKSDEDVASFLQSGKPSGIFVSRTATLGSKDIEERLKQLRSQRQHLLVVLVDQFNEYTFELAFKLAREGTVDLLVDSRKIDGVSILAALAKVEAESVFDHVCGRLGELPHPKEVIIRRALRSASQPLSVRRLAKVNAVEERTLRKQCERWGMPSPRRLAAWSRLLLAAWWLDNGNLTQARIAERLNFPSPDALRKLSVRTLGLSLRSFERGEALDSVCSMFVADLDARNRGLPVANRVVVPPPDKHDDLR